MGSEDWQAIAHRVYSMLDANLLVLNCGNSSDGLGDLAREMDVRIRVEARR